jgi:hypothetical protein
LHSTACFVPSPLARSLEAQFGLSGSEVSDLVCPVQALKRVAKEIPSMQPRHDECARLLHHELRYDAGPSAGVLESQAGRAQLVNVLLQTSSELRRAGAGHPEATQALIDDFVATILAVLIPRYVRHFRLYMPPLVLGSVMSVLMSSVYFVQPQRLITSLIFVWVAAYVLTIFVVYIALDRDPVISAMCDSTPGAVSWNWALARRAVSWGLLPMASLFAAQYPQFAFWISSMFDAIAKGFR